jgi:hypothetical protein
MEMTDEQMKWEFEQAEMFFGGGNKNAGQLVETKTGLVGRTYNHEDLINGKIRVYTDKGKLLCDPTTLKLKGFID